jgi:hypothetical protein
MPCHAHDCWRLAKEFVHRIQLRGMHSRHLTNKRMASSGCLSRSPRRIISSSSTVIGDVVDTFPNQLKHLYKRTVSATTLRDATDCDLPYFVKLQGSNKDFVARVIRTPQEDEAVRIELGVDDPVYICEVVDFCNEFRLCIAPESTLWACCEYSEYMVGHRLLNADDTTETPLEIKDVHQVPADFSVQVLASVPSSFGFVVVDVGLTKCGKWCVVECNPPFALSSYDLAIERYVEYCVAAWQDILDHRQGNGE